MGPGVLIAYVPVCLGPWEGSFQSQAHDTVAHEKLVTSHNDLPFAYNK